MTTLEKTHEQHGLNSVNQQSNVEVERDTFLPRTDVVDHKEKVEILVEMPGVDKESVNISLEKNILTIEGKTRSPENREGYSLIVGEFPNGNYHRTFTLGHELDEENIQARMKDGVLRLTLPRREDVGPRKINVNS